MAHKAHELSYELIVYTPERIIWGTSIGVTERDTRSSDYSSYDSEKVLMLGAGAAKSLV